MPNIKPTFRLNPALHAQWKAAIGDLISIGNKNDPESIHKLVTLSARRFVKNVAAITAPNQGTLDSLSKKRGEEAILGDLLKIAIPTTVAGSSRHAREALSSAADLVAVHERSRVNSGGRVNPRSRKEKLLVSQSTFNQTYNKLAKRVGWLAGALNAAADKLGFSLPAWIKRHGNHYGSIEVNATQYGMRVRVVQNVPYADDVKGYARKWDFALKKEITALINQAKVIVAKKAAKAAARLK
jgi:hypothetical protein